jgi:porin
MVKFVQSNVPLAGDTMRLSIKLAGAMLSTALACGNALAQEASITTTEGQQPVGDFGGPNAVPNQINSDREQTLLGRGIELGENWDGWKAKIQEDYGFGMGADYTGVYLNASDTVPGGRDSTGAGILRVYGAWDLLGRNSGNTGSFVWKFEHRHGYANPAPAPLYAITEVGYLGLFNPPFNDTDFRTQNFYWRQRFGEGRYSMVAGFLDVTDFLDLYGMISPWLHFTNFAFSTGSATIDLPNDAGLGVGLGAMLTDNIYFVGSLQDANGNPEEVWESVDTFFDDSEYFTSAELGWTSGQDAIYLDNYHVTLWHKDKREEAGKPSGWGANFSFARFVNETWMPFLRGGYSDDGDSLLEKSLSGGVGYRLRGRKDLLGAGLNWGEPNPNQGVGNDAQYAAEVFYRLLVGKRLNLTADLQYIKDPAINQLESSAWVFGMRGRLAF